MIFFMIYTDVLNWRRIIYNEEEEEEKAQGHSPLVYLLRIGIEKSLWYVYMNYAQGK